MKRKTQAVEFKSGSFKKIFVCRAGEGRNERAIRGGVSVGRRISCDDVRLAVYEAEYDGRSGVINWIR